MHSCKLAQKRLEVWMGYHTNLNSKAEERKIKAPHILEKTDTPADCLLYIL